MGEISLMEKPQEGLAMAGFLQIFLDSHIISAEGLRVKEALPPYLDPNLKIEDLLTGVCFASAGAGFDPVTNELASVLSIEDQLNMFKEYKGKLIAAVGEEKTSLILADSVIIISMGSNDISGTYFLSPYRRIMYNIEDYTTMLVNASSNFLQELYNLGARRIGVLSLGPVGCVPMQRTISGGKDRKCVESVNQASRVYNSKISSSIVALSQSLPDARLVYLEIYDEFNHVMEHLSQFGFEEGSKQCCGIANLEVGPFCNSFALKICEDASKYVFWDSYHPTEKFYSILVTMLIEKNVNKFV
ncbi:hypothetical protein RJT34_30567 [Clitoria ternatea]|uniref:Uncharacterized protein n=1 Tax=Clitoria ternatea TaxID=43366 RepID=A0AAN9ETQ5_CLITE